MVVRKPLPPLTPAELRFWQAAFLAAELPLLADDGKKLAPEGAAHLCAEFADTAVREYQTRRRR